MFVAETLSKHTLDPDGPVKPLDFSEIWEAGESGMQSVISLKDAMARKPDWLSEDWQLLDDDAEPKPQPQKPASTRKASPKVSAPQEAPSKIQVISSSLADEYSDYESGDEPDLVPYSMPSA